MFPQNYVPVLWDEKEESVSPVASGEDQPCIASPPTSKAVQAVFQSMRQVSLDLDNEYVPMMPLPAEGWSSVHPEPALAVDPAHSQVPRVSLTSSQYSLEEIHSSPLPVVMEVMGSQEADL